MVIHWKDVNNFDPRISISHFHSQALSSSFRNFYWTSVHFHGPQYVGFLWTINFYLPLDLYLKKKLKSKLWSHHSSLESRSNHWKQLEAGKALLKSSLFMKHYNTQEVGKNTWLCLVFSPTLLSCSTASCMLYNRIVHSQGFYICKIIYWYVLILAVLQVSYD